MTITEKIEHISKWTAENFEKEVNEINIGSGENDFAQIEKMVSEKLPKEFVEVYSKFNGEGGNQYGILFGLEFISTKKVISNLDFALSLVKPTERKIINQKKAEEILNGISELFLKSIPNKKKFGLFSKKWEKASFNCSHESYSGVMLKYENGQPENFKVKEKYSDKIFALGRELHQLEQKNYNWDSLEFDMTPDGKFTVERKDYVWEDEDNDGLQDPTEDGVEGVTVTLLDEDGVFVESTTTNPDGFYEFTNLTPGTYTVVFSDVPASYTLVNPNQGNDAEDSDANTVTGATLPITLESGENNDTVDAGIEYVCPEITASITNTDATCGDDNGSATATGGKDLMARGVLKGGTNAYATLHFSSTGSNDNATDAAAFADFSIVTGKIDGNLSVQGATGTINRTYGAGSFFMAKINSLGTADWVIPNNNAQLSEGQAITTDPLGNIYVAGIYRDSLVLGSSTIRSEGANDVFVAKFNSNGVVQWLKSMGGPGSEEVAGLVYDNGDLIVAGNFNSTFLLSTNQSLIPNVTGQNDVYLVKIDANSATGVHSTFRKAFFSNGAVSAEDIVALSNGNYAVGGGFSTAIDDGSNNFTSAGGTDAFIGIVNSSFNAVLLKKYGGVLTEKITNLEADTNLFAFGEFASNLTFGPYPVSSLSNQKDVFLLAWNNSLLEFAVHGGVMTAGSDIMSATTMKLDSGRMYFGGQFRRRANFGQAGLFTSQGTGFFDGFLASPPACAIESKPMKLENSKAAEVRNRRQSKSTFSLGIKVRPSFSCSPTKKSEVSKMSPDTITIPPSTNIKNIIGSKIRS